MQQGWNELNSRKKQGLSLPFVACAGALLVAFALAIVYTAGLMMSNANNKLAEERCYQLAKSFAGVVTKELEKPDGEFCTFANKFLDDSAYNEYSPDNPNTLYYYRLQKPEDEQYGEIELRLRKEINAYGTAGLEGTLDVPGHELQDYTETIKNLRSVSFQRHIFVVEVIARQDDLTYNYTTEYYRVDTYPIEFRYKGDVIVWDDTVESKCWKYGSTSGDPCKFDDSDEKIQYTYKTEKPESSKFVPMHAEGGAS